MIRQFTDLVGRSEIPPYWSLGFQLCRYGYGSSAATRAAWQRTIDAGIPFVRNLIKVEINLETYLEGRPME